MGAATIRTLARLLGYGIFWTPLAVLALWGLAYLRECLDVLAAPGTSLVIYSKSRGGMTTLRADTYSFDIASMSLVAHGVSIFSPKDLRLATADLASIRLPDLFGGSRRVLSVRLKDLDATLERDADGRLTLFDVLPPESKEPSVQPFSVEIEDARITLVDHTDTESFRRLVRIPWARVDGIGADWRADARLLPVTGGAAVVSLRNEDKKGLRASARLSDFDLAPWLGPVKRTDGTQEWEGLQDFRADALTTTGTAALWQPLEGPVKFSATLSAEGRSVSYGDFQASSAQMNAKLDTKGALGWLEAKRPGFSARFEGQARWDPDTELLGHLEATAARPADIPAAFRSSIPKSLNFRNGRYEGRLALHPKSGLSAFGSLAAERAAWDKYVAEGVQGLVRFDDDQLSVRNLKGRYRGVLVEGGGDLQRKSELLVAYASTGTLPIEQFRAETGLTHLTGLVQLSATANGTLKKPNIELRAKGRAAYALEPGHPTELGPFHALATYDGSEVRLNRLAFAGPAGIATVSGTIALPQNRFDLAAVATGIDLARLHSKLQGTATGTMRLTGTPQDFLVKGPVEVYGLRVQEQSIPLANGELEITPRKLVARQLTASRGAARLHGEVGWTFETGALDGLFVADGVQLHDFMEEGYEGSLDVTQGRLSGTIDHPVVEGSARGKDMVLKAIRIDSFESQLKIEGTHVEARSSRIMADTGFVTATGVYDWQTKAGMINGTATGLPLVRIQPLLPPATAIEGRLSSSFSASLVENRLAVLETDGAVEDLSVNGAFLGNGFYDVQAHEMIWTGTVEVGQPERFIQIGEFNYDAEHRLLAADITGFGLPVRDLYVALKPFMEPAPGGEKPAKPTLTVLDRLQGNVDVNASISGSATNPDLILESVILRDSKLDGEPTGRLEASGSRKDEKWQIKDLKWTGGPGTLDLKGTVDENGPIALDGNAYNFDTQWLARFLPGLAQVSGDATLFFTVSGPTKNPQIEASLNGSLFEAGLVGDKRDKDKELKLEIYPILVSNGEISVNGLFNYRGFRGTLEGTVPFEYPFTFPEEKSVKIDVHVPGRPLKEFVELFPTLNAARTEGSVSADLAITGPPDALAVNGKIQLEAKSMAFAQLDTVLQDVLATAQLKGTRLEISSKATSAKGGSLVANANLDFGGIDELLSSDFGELLAHRVDGNLQMKGFRVAEKNLALDEKGESLLNLDFSASGGIRLSGSLEHPIFSTFVPLAIERLKGEIPSVFAESPSGGEAAVSPEFRIAYVVGTRAQPAELKASASVLNLYGAGTLKGTLDDLEANADLRLKGGFLRLPNARIALQDGGTVKLRYDNSAFDSSLRLDVDIEGRTSLSTIRYGTLVERYDIMIELRGNLLNSEEQVILARSDPPDLSQERILNLLGQIDLLQNLSGPITGTQERRQLQQALNTLAIPVFFDPVTNAIAKELGFEYLSVDYGPLGQTNITAAKWLGKGFLLQGTREISDPIDGVPDFDLRLTYRPPRRIRTLRGLIFSLGLDQDRPWKISVEYGQRFRNFGKANPSSVIRIGP